MLAATVAVLQKPQPDFESVDQTITVLLVHHVYWRGISLPQQPPPSPLPQAGTHLEVAPLPEQLLPLGAAPGSCAL